MVSEREMKRVVLNRKNSLFVGNPRGGRTAAILASLTSTCRRHELDPQLYLTQLLMNLPQARMSVSRRYLCESFPECLGPCHGGTWSAPACFFPHVIGLPPYAIEVGLTRVNPVKPIS